MRTHRGPGPVPQHALPRLELGSKIPNREPRAGAWLQQPARLSTHSSVTRSRKAARTSNTAFPLTSPSTKGCSAPALQRGRQLVVAPRTCREVSSAARTRQALLPGTLRSF